MRNWMVTTGVVMLLAAHPVKAQDMEALVAEGQARMMTFGEALKAELMAAIEAGGPVNAIAVCNEVAPQIARDLSTDGWTVARSSHRLRNPENAADEFTARAIAGFLAREAAGEPATDLSTAAIVEDGGTPVFHLVRAIPTAELCVNCHGGDTVKPEVEAKLAELYPEDKARGFSVGEMRGVFTLTKVLQD